jgi:two-component system, OmpR family, alkaline phosphatase synthesis response regulator PhoP
MNPPVKKVLIVEDDPNFALALEFLFAQNGFQVEVARTGEEALDRMDLFRPDVLLSEARLPFRSGFEICQIVHGRSQWQPVRIVLMTSSNRDPETAKARALGADACLTKPFSTADLLAAANKLPAHSP